MLVRRSKPNTAKAKRELGHREAKVIENTKSVLLIRGQHTSQNVNTALSNLYLLKKPFSVHFTKKNNVRPFEDVAPLQDWTRKNDASLFVVGSHSKKRPDNLVFGRMFDFNVLDMIELKMIDFKGLDDFKTDKCALGSKPCMIFQGEWFEQKEDYAKLKNMFLDFFGGVEIKHLDLKGLEWVISITASEDLIFFRVYKPMLLKSGSRLPRVELEEMGPRFDFKIDRTQFASEETYKLATKKPKELVAKKKKNVKIDEMGDKLGRVYLDKQDFSKLQTRKMKGLKKRKSEDENDSKKMKIDE